MEIREGENILNAVMTLIQGSLEGFVTEEGTGDPLANVIVTLPGKSTITDTDGYYVITGIVPGAYAITFEKEGYITRTY